MTEQKVGEAKRREEAEAQRPERQTTPYFEELLRQNAAKCVDAALMSMGILANNGDDKFKAILVVRSVAATYASAHLPPDDHVPFFQAVSQCLVEVLRVQPQSSIVVAKDMPPPPKVTLR